MQTTRTARLTPSEEGYIETIHSLIKKQGYARVSDIAATLNVKPPSVTNMIKRLDAQEFVNYTRYRGVVLSAKGRVLAEALEKRHQALKRFLTMIGVGNKKAEKDACEIEHQIDRETVEMIGKFVEFMQSTPETSNFLKAFKAIDKTGN